MTAPAAKESAAPAELVRLHVTRRPAIDTEGPYLDDGGSVDGTLALARPVARPTEIDPDGEPDAPPTALPLCLPLRLVPGPDEGGADEPPDEDDEPPYDDGEPPYDDTLCFDPVRTPRHQLPAPGPYAATLARLLLEVLAGDRPVRQLTRWTTPEVCDELEVLVSPRSPRPWAGSLRRLLLCEPVPGVAEVTAVVALGVRTRALALRLEGVDGRWQLTALQLG